MTDLEFIRRFEATNYTAQEWTHEAHIRMGWYYLSQLGLREAISRVRTGIQKLNAVIGTTGRGYHETITVFFLELIDNRWIVMPDLTWADFKERNADLFQFKILFEYYSSALVESPKAKAEYLPPDLRKIPPLPLSVRDVELNDIPTIIRYWATLSESDIKRMYIDKAKLLTSEVLRERLTKVISNPQKDPEQVTVVWKVAEKTVGLVNSKFDGADGEPRVHLHMMDARFRGRGLGEWFFVNSVLKCMERFGVETIYCEPAATNPHPNRLLEKLKFPLERSYTGIASPICIEQPINRYRLEKEHILLLNKYLSSSNRYF